MEKRIRDLINKDKLKFSEIMLKIDPRNYGIFSKYSYYLFISSLILLIFITILLLNGYLHFISPPKYDEFSNFIGEKYSLLSYLGVFVLTAFSPLPDYFIVPILGYAAFLGFLNFWYVVLVSTVADVSLMSIDYAGGRFAGRAIVLKFMRFLGLKSANLTNAEEWIHKHGIMSIFIATFIPFIKHVVSVSAGTLKMNVGMFVMSNFVGFFVRFLLLAYVGYRGIYIFSPSFDYSIRLFLYIAGVITLVYILYHIIGKLRKFKKILLEIYGILRV